MFGPEEAPSRGPKKHAPIAGISVLKPAGANSGIILWQSAALAWAIEIFSMSTASFGDQQSRSMLVRSLSLIQLDISKGTFDLLNAVLRKTAHLGEYAIFCFLIYQSLGQSDGGRSHLRRTVWSFAIAAAYSLSDEFHQIFVPGRHASLIDCGVDAAGAALAMLLVHWRSRVLEIRASSSSPKEIGTEPKSDKSGTFDPV